METVNDEIRRLVEDMAQTMYAAPGVGLAATQVDVHKQVIVIDISETHDQLLVLINPEILESRGVSDFEEGCLSVPGIYEKIPRAEVDQGARLGSGRAAVRARSGRAACRCASSTKWTT